MPYIDLKLRERINLKLAELAPLIEGPGMLNYAITKLVLAKATPLDYRKIVEVTGILENVKQEFYRRVAVPYEEDKRRLNGDVY